MMDLITKNQEELEKLADEAENELEDIFILLASLATAETLLLTPTTVQKWELTWSRLLQSSGFYDFLKVYSERLDTLDKSVKTLTDSLNISSSLSSSQKTSLSVLKEMQIKDIEKIGIEAGTRLKRTLYQNLISGVSQQDLVKTMAKDLQNNRYKAYAKTYASTAINDYRQALINARVSAEDEVVWVYEGADIDGKTRDFCKCVINNSGYYSYDNKLIIENNPKRRYNCRHGLFPYKENEAKKLGLKLSGVTCS